MDLSQEFAANELVELIELEMKAAGMEPRIQVGRQKGPVTSRKPVNGVIIIWDSVDGRPYDKNSFLYRIITAPGLSISGSIFGPHPHCFSRDSPERETIERITQKFTPKGYSLYKDWGRLAEYRPITS